MDQSVMAGTALLHAAWKRGLLDAEQRDRLLQVFAVERLDGSEAVRRWLEAGAGIDPGVARQLIRLQVRPDQGRLGDYLLLADLEEGGIGRVCLAADAAGRLVVVKTMRKNLARIPEYVRRFEREIDLMRTLRHPCLVQCLDVGTAADGTAYLAMEYVAGCTLKEYAGRRGLEEVEALRLVYQLLDALDYVADRGLLHRDIKPSNIFVAGERCKLADFGLARNIDEEGTSLTMQGSLVGTPHYMSPEQIRAETALDARSDLYALGAVLYFALTGRDPYAGARYEIMHAHCSAAVPEVRRVNPDISTATEALIVRAMQKDPEARFASAAAMREAVGGGLDAVCGDLATLVRSLAGWAEEPAALPLAERPGSAALPAADEPTPAATPLVEPAATAGQGPMTASAASARPAPRLDQTIPADLMHEYQRAEHRPQDRTIGADLMADWRAGPGRTPDDDGVSEDQEGTRAHLAQQHTPVGIAATPTGRSGSSPGVTERRPVGERFVGEFTAAAAIDWLCLRESGGTGRILLWARPELVLGKMRQEPVDLCLRNYPVAVHKEQCQRVSRQHLRLAAGPEGLGIVDLGSANGTRYDGFDLMANRPQAVVPGPEHLLEISGVVNLRLRVLHRASEVVRHLPGAPASTGAEACGIDVSRPVDAVLLTRPDNAPEIAYVQVLRRLSLGGGTAALRVCQALGPETIEIARYAGRWIRRPGQSTGAAWEPVLLGERLRAGGRTWLVEAGGYDHFN